MPRERFRFCRPRAPSRNRKTGESMKKQSLAARAAVVAALVASLVGGTAVAANAESAGGGTWYYGVEGVQAYNYSHYLHNSYYHRASVVDGNNYRVRAYGEASQWARARQSATAWGNTAQWYHNNGGRNF